ncbi:MULTISPECIES: hypothetical protein [Thiomicrorhabdus]|uniref:YbgF trimerisation domain-containing protein n=1 Tax=Thiomicrorhabdus heinhorstiae TaxID=2748010 RepID=A0ABS0BY18_9GAMM|nr:MULTISPECIES: hypothetical protein [Thiomicrorhabdus]MBF6058693.1 hypothetical protein [Thiomicrorhabdus heinhorstiae]
MMTILMVASATVQAASISSRVTSLERQLAYQASKLKQLADGHGGETRQAELNQIQLQQLQNKIDALSKRLQAEQITRQNSRYSFP